jgi:folate-dependent phosphoribosylglycinamide formyltransferase PurN
MGEGMMISCFVVFMSGSGANLQALIDAAAGGGAAFAWPAGG